MHKYHWSLEPKETATNSDSDKHETEHSAGIKLATNMV